MEPINNILGIEGNHYYKTENTKPMNEWWILVEYFYLIIVVDILNGDSN